MIEFRALGPAHLSGPAGTNPQAVLGRPKLLGVLAYLSVGAHRGFHRRDSLIGTFWPELSQERARGAVRQSLYRLRQFLGEAVIETRGDDEVAIVDAAFHSDVTAFEEALAAGRFAEALGLYRGDLLDGLYVPDAPEFERWLDERRTQLRNRAATAAWELADQEADARNTIAARRLSRQARQLAPLDERLARHVIRLLDRLGDRAGAVREYDSFARRLATELELQPAPETRALIDEVRARNQAFLSASRPPSDLPEELSAPALPAEVSGAGGLTDRYRLEDEIGSGAMATVFRARDLRHHRDVAVKVMHPELASQLGAERFLHEIRIAANLAHPHIVPVYDSGSDGGSLFYVMPLIDGESLRDRLEREKQIPLEEALQYASDVSEALTYAHHQGIVHRDIKPENILLAEGHALVADFGIARALSLANEARLTHSGMVVGTPVYMSPEQAAGRGGEADHRSDLYSLACVVYEMLAGVPPFTGATAESIARQHLTSAPRPLTALRADVPRHVSDALDRALAKAPEERFGQVADFVLALHTPGAVARRPGRRAVLVAALAVLLVAGVQAARWILTGRGPPPDPNRIVVVPFENRTGDSTLALLGSMAADWITQGLHEIDVIEVVPTATAIEPGPDVPHGVGVPVLERARQIGAATRAGTLVAGAYYRRGDSLEFQTQIIDAAAERLMRAVAPVTTAGPATGAVLDSLRRRVVVAVASVLDRRLAPSAPASRPPSLEAYRAYLRGHRAFHRAGGSNLREVLTFMYQAVALDSLFPDPRFFLIMAHQDLGEMRAADSNATLLLPLAPRLTPYQRATLDWMVASLRGDRAGALRAARARGGAWDLAVEALYSNRPHETIEILNRREGLAQPEFFFKWHTLMEAYHLVGDHASELREARRAVKAHPDRLLLLRDELQALAALGRVAEVREILDRRLPASLPYWDVADLNLAAGAELRAHGNRDAGLRIAERLGGWLDSQQDEPDTLRLLWWRALTRYAAEQWGESRNLFASVSAAAPRDVNAHGFLGVLAARLGDLDEARRISDELEGTADPYDHGRDVYWQACIAAQLGERDRAMALLREAFRRGRRFGIQTHRDMDLEPLHGDARFEEFLTPAG